VKDNVGALNFTLGADDIRRITEAADKFALAEEPTT